MSHPTSARKLSLNSPENEILMIVLIGGFFPFAFVRPAHFQPVWRPVSLPGRYSLTLVLPRVRTSRSTPLTNIKNLRGSIFAGCQAGSGRRCAGLLRGLGLVSREGEGEALTGKGLDGGRGSIKKRPLPKIVFIRDQSIEVFLYRVWRDPSPSRSAR